MTEVFKSTASATRIIGLAGTGKTENLLDRLVECMNQETTTEDIVVFCATPNAATAFKTRLEQKLSHAPSGIKITYPQEFTLGILSENDAIAYTGRKPRLLVDLEINFLLEDMKVGGLRPKRLREMLKFFYRSWTELADDDPSWLITGEESDTHALLKSNLAFLQGIIEPELSNFAFKYLRENEEACIRHTARHVFVDDYQCLNRASQALVNTIAEESITIAGHALECFEVSDPYPYALGLDEFKQINPHAADVELDKSYLSHAVTEAANNLLADESIGVENAPLVNESAPSGSLETLKSAYYEEEFTTIASYAAEKIEQGTSPSEIFIITPNKSWNKKMSKALESKGLAVDALSNKQALNGDIRSYDQCGPLRIYSALRLAADSTDAVAWRSWCGYGDFLTNSGDFSKIREYAENEGLTLVEVFERLDNEPELIPGVIKVLGAYRAGKALLKKVSGLDGLNLLNGLTAFITAGAQNEAPEVLLSLCDPRSGNLSDTIGLVASISQSLLSPTFSFQEDAIKVGMAKHLCGLSPKIVIYSGFVNGFIPDRDYFDGTKTPLDKQRKIHEEDTRNLYTVIGKAQQDLAFSYFTKADLESAEMLKLEIGRIRLEEGKRICMIEPSEFFAVIQG